MAFRQRLENLVNWKKRFASSRANGAKSGFTLTELLVVIVISGIIVSTLMALVVELISTEQRESTRTETQRSMQLALNYIAADIKQAVYIYDADPHPEAAGSEPSYLNFLPEKFADGEGYKPVVAFWKPRSINMDEDTNLTSYDACRTDFSSNTALRLECENLWKQRRAYSLVVYFQVSNTKGNDKGLWSGESRIERYELFKYKNPNNGTTSKIFDKTKGFVDPAGLGANSFRTWPFSGAKNCQNVACADGGTSAGGRPDAGAEGSSLAVLTDFVDDPTAVRPDEPVECNDFGVGGADYKRVPKYSAAVSETNQGSNSFFICLRDTGDNIGEAQDVIVYLRGNARGRGGSQSDSFLPTLQTRITMRGIIDKNVGSSGS